ncbi:MAG: radical SAM protein [Anaerocolumna sp.]
MEYDIILVQPILFKDLIVSENTKIEYNYWRTMEKYAGKLLGDLPTEPSNGILSIATYLEQYGYKVKVLDFHLLDFLERKKSGKRFSLSKIIEKIALYKAKFWGLSMMTISENNCFEIINEIRKMYPYVFIFAGGYYPTNNSDLVMNRNRNIDFIVKNEGEFTIKDILDKYKEKGDIAFNCYNVVYRLNGELREATNINNFVVDINVLPELDYDLYDDEILKIIVPRVYTARGCENNCIYCTADNASNKTYRKREVNRVVEEIEHLVHKYNKKFFVMGDLEFLSDLEHAEQICKEIINRKLGVKWWCQIYPMNVNEESLKLIKEAGCIQVALGIESNDEKSLEILNKAVNIEKSVNACKMIKRYGMQVQAYLILGLPNDTVDSMISLIKFAGELINRDYIDVTHLSVMVPYPGSAIFNNREKFQIQIIDYDANRFFMNCDFLGGSIPPYNLKNVTGSELYSLWLFGLSYFTKCFRKKTHFQNEYKQIYKDLGIDKISILDKNAILFGGEQNG